MLNPPMVNALEGCCFCAFRAAFLAFKPRFAYRWNTIKYNRGFDINHVLDAGKPFLKQGRHRGGLYFKGSKNFSGLALPQFFSAMLFKDRRNFPEAGKSDKMCSYRAGP